MSSVIKYYTSKWDFYDNSQDLHEIVFHWVSSFSTSYYPFAHHMTGCHIVHAPLHCQLHNFFFWLVMVSYLITQIFIQLLLLLLCFQHTWKTFSPKLPFFILLFNFYIYFKTHRASSLSANDALKRKITNLLFK